MKRFTPAIALGLIISISSITLGAKRSKPAAHTWHITADPQARLATAWATYEIKDGKVTDITYGNARVDDRPLTKAADLFFDAKSSKGELKVTFNAAGDDKMTTDAPEGAKLRERTMPAVDHLTGDYQMLWIGDWMKDGKVVQSMAYTVRGMPTEDKTSGLDATGVKKLEAALLAAESHPTTAPAAVKH